MSERKPKVYTQGLSFREKIIAGKSVFNLYISPKFLDWVEQNKNERGGVSIDVWPRDVPDQYGNTHNSYLNDFVASQKGKENADKDTMSGLDSSDDDLPF
jgi:hypothetical protein